MVGERYRVLEEVGAGAYGTVYRAQHVVTQRVVALKVLHAHMAHDEPTRARFAREVAAPASIEHPGIVEVLDAAIDEDGRPFLAMEWLEGETLRELLERGQLSLRDLLELFVKLLEPLDAAHGAGFVHRDLKPDNVFVHATKRGRELRVLDFGLVRRDDSPSVTETGTAIGTPRYMSPEQFMDSKSAGPPADVWALGTMLYEALAGEPPFRATSHALMLAVLTAPHVPLEERVPTLPPALMALVESCLRKEPSERPADAAALMAGLRAVLAELDAQSAAVTIREMPRVEIPASSQAATTVMAATDPATLEAATTVMPVSGPIPAGLPPTRPAAPPRRAIWPWLVAFGLLGAMGVTAIGAALWMGRGVRAEPSPRAEETPPLPTPAVEPDEVAPMMPAMEPAVAPPSEGSAAGEIERPAETRERPARAPRAASRPAPDGDEESPPPPPPPPEGERPSLPNPFELLHPLTED